MVVVFVIVVAAKEETCWAIFQKNVTWRSLIWRESAAEKFDAALTRLADRSIDLSINALVALLDLVDVDVSHKSITFAFYPFPS
jgi:hypothetical protein